MGVASAYGADPIRLARAVLEDPEETSRRIDAQERRAFYEENSEAAIKNVINKLFKSADVRARVYDFARLSLSQSLFKRVTDEVSRTVYMVPPVRKVDGDEDQKKFQAISSEVGLDDVMDLGLRLGFAGNSALMYTRFIERLDKIAVNVIPADCFSVIPDPDDNLRAVAYIYDKPVMKTDGTSVKWHVYWDDTVKFQLDENHNIVPFRKGGPAMEPNLLGRMPLVAIHTVPRYGTWWNMTPKRSLVEAHKSCALLTLLSMRKLKARGFRQVVISGDAHGVPKGQSLDEEGAVFTGDAQMTELGQEADADNYLKMIDAIKTDAAANFGISRARLNQTRAGDTDDTGLMETRAEMIRVMRPVEVEQFEVLQIVSQEYGDARAMSGNATMSIDYGELQHRVDPKTELELWDTRRRMGVASVLDQIKAQNPEIRTNAEAWTELDENMKAESIYVERRRALNISERASMQEPGQDAVTNGAMGPMVRDGRMTRDEAAQLSTGGADDDPVEQQ